MSSNPFNSSNHPLIGNTAEHLLLCDKCICYHTVSIVDPLLPKMKWLTKLK